MEGREDKFVLSGNISEDKVYLQQFLEEYLEAFIFPNLTVNAQRQAWTSLFHYLEQEASKSIHVLCLRALRVLSRDKTELNNVVCEQWMDTLLQLAGFYTHEEYPNTAEYDTQVESLKCLCNIVFNCSVAQAICSRNRAIDGIFTRLKIWGANVPYEIKYFDMKLLFLISALSEDVRPRIRTEYHGLLYLVETLDMILKESPHTHPRDIVLTDEQACLICEILKALFNISLKHTKKDVSHFPRIVFVIHNLLLCQTIKPARQYEVRLNCVNLLTSIPGKCYHELITLVLEDVEEHKEFEFDGRDMSALIVLFAFFKQKLEICLQVPNKSEILSPILTVFTKGVHRVRLFRKFVRPLIFPPLTDVDVMTRPETGNSIRSQLVQLLTTPSAEFSFLVGKFIYWLLKTNVERMIKYVGYGNAAGFLATLAANPANLKDDDDNDDDDDDEVVYSSDSDSDTEEYTNLKDFINPVVGCYEPPRPDPTQHMTEEQKEYEAMQLVKLLDKMSMDGLVKPCRLGPDGRPEPVDHILQLQDENKIVLDKTNKK